MVIDRDYSDGEVMATEDITLTVSAGQNQMIGSSIWTVTDIAQQTSCSGTSDITLNRNLPGNCMVFDGVWVMEQPVCLDSACSYTQQALTIRPQQEHCVFGGRYDRDGPSNLPLYGTIDGNSVEFPITKTVSPDDINFENLIIVFQLTLTTPTRLEGTVHIAGPSTDKVPVAFLKQ